MPSTLEQVGITRKQFIEKYFRVLNKQKELVPLKLNRIQDLELSEQSDIGRDLYVKPAQIGSTTLWVAVALADCMTEMGNTAVIVSYSDEHAGRLLLKANQLVHNIRTEVDGVSYQWPGLGRENTGELFFPDLSSTLFTGSARQYNFGRGEPIHFLVGSEIGFWPDPSKILLPAQDRVTRGGQIVLESTPNGQEGDGKYFFDMFKASEEGHSVYTSHFYPWWFHDEYQIEEGSKYALPNDRKSPLTLTDEEEELCTLHDLTDDHIRWRRFKHLEKRQSIELGGMPLLFQQEFPEDKINCWLISGEGFYDPLTIEKLARGCYTADKSYNGAAIWYPPEEGHDYSITIDPGMGKQSRSVVHVWETIEIDDIEYDRHCATASGKWLGSATVDVAVDLANHYFGATICPEANIPDVCALLVERRYPRLYMRQDWISGRSTRVAGWLTTPKTKMIMFQRMQENLPRVISHDINFVGQLPNVRREAGTGKVYAQAPDDHHDAGALYSVCKRNSGMGKSGYAGNTAPSNTWWDR